MIVQYPHIVVYYTFLSESDKEKLIQKSQLFPEPIRKRIFDYQIEIDRLSRICSKLLLIEALNSFYPEVKNPLSLIEGEQGHKPKIRNYDFDFSSSYSEDLVVVAFSKNNTVGVDVEKKKSFNHGHYKDFLHPKELDFLNLQENSSEEFLKIWTRKEALVKAKGSGIFMGLEKICVLENEIKENTQTFHFQDLSISESYQASLAYRNVGDIILKKYIL